MASPGSNASLLAGAAAYAIDCVSHVTPGVLSCPTPCAGWDAATLLRHVNDSLTAVHEGIAAGHVGPGPADPGTGDQGMDLVATFCDLACGLLTASVTADRQHRPITIAGRRLPAGILMSVAAVEVAVHGWDVACACRRPQPIPPALATGLLQAIPPLVPPAARNALFAAPVPVPPQASPGDRLIARLGRAPANSTDSRPWHGANVRAGFSTWPLLSCQLGPLRPTR
jgi:uncharacterized protein (TIGR03086 family)